MLTSAAQTRQESHSSEDNLVVAQVYDETGKLVCRVLNPLGDMNVPLLGSFETKEDARFLLNTLVSLHKAFRCEYFVNGSSHIVTLEV